MCEQTLTDRCLKVLGPQSGPMSALALESISSSRHRLKKTDVRSELKDLKLIRSYFQPMECNLSQIDQAIERSYFFESLVREKELASPKTKIAFF